MLSWRRNRILPACVRGGKSENHRRINDRWPGPLSVRFSLVFRFRNGSAEVISSPKDSRRNRESHKMGKLRHKSNQIPERPPRSVDLDPLQTTRDRGAMDATLPWGSHRVELTKMDA